MYPIGTKVGAKLACVGIGFDFIFIFSKGNIYYSRYQKGKEYEIYCRKKDEPNAKEEVIKKKKKNRITFIFPSSSSSS